MKSFFRGHRRVQSESWSFGSSNREPEQYGTLKRLNPISFLRRNSVNFDELETFSSSADAYKDAGIIVGTRTHDWSGSRMSTESSNGRISESRTIESEQELSVMVEEEEIDHLNDSKRESRLSYSSNKDCDKELVKSESKDVCGEGADLIEYEEHHLQKGQQLEPENDRNRYNNDVSEDESERRSVSSEKSILDHKRDEGSDDRKLDGDQHSIFSFEEEQEIGRNLSINYHKPSAGYDGDRDNDSDNSDGNLDTDMALEMGFEAEEEDDSHLFQDYESRYDMITPTAPLQPAGLVRPLNIATKSSSNAHNLTEGEVAERHAEDKIDMTFNATNRNTNIDENTETNTNTDTNAYLSRTLKLESRKSSYYDLYNQDTYNYDDDDENYDDDDDFYDSLVDEVNAVPGEDDYEDSLSFRSLSTSSSNYSSRGGSLRSSSSASFRRSLSRRLSSVVRHQENTVTLFSHNYFINDEDELGDLVSDLPAPMVKPILTPISERSDSDTSSPIHCRSDP